MPGGWFAGSLPRYGKRVGLGKRTHPAGIRQWRHSPDGIAKQDRIVIAYTRGGNNVIGRKFCCRLSFPLFHTCPSMGH